MLDEGKINKRDYELLKEKYSKEELALVEKKIKEEDYPIQYAIGNVQFIDKIIEVDERVLIPRFATELLVSKTLEYIEKKGLANGPFIDICTGSGCIAVSLAAKYPSVKIEACDKSEGALEVAKRNGKLNKVDIDFYLEDILKTEKLKSKYSLIIANPPYVKKFEEVSKNTKYEPQIALYPGEDDIVFYKKIIELSKDALLDKSMIAFEIGSTQVEEIVTYAKKVFPDSAIKVEKDYENFDRFVFIFKNCE